MKILISNRTIYIYIQAVVIIACFFVSAQATLAPPVIIKLDGIPHPAFDGEPYHAAFSLTASEDVRLTDISIGENGWILDKMDVPTVLDLKAGESRVFQFTATPEDAGKPFAIMMNIDGRILKKEYIVSKQRYDRLVKPGKLKKHTSPDEHPAAVRKTIAQTDPAEEVAEKNREPDVLKQIFYELRMIRADIRKIQQNLDRHRLSVEQKQYGQSARSRQFIRMQAVAGPVLGKKDAPTTLVMFTDYTDPGCRLFFREILPKLKQDYLDTGKLRFVLRQFPSTDSSSYQQAAASVCMEQNGEFISTQQSLFSSSDIFSTGAATDSSEIRNCMDSPVTKKRIESNVREAQRLGIKTAPSFIIGLTTEKTEFKGELISGSQSYPFIADTVERLLAPRKQ